MKIQNEIWNWTVAPLLSMWPWELERFLPYSFSPQNPSPIEEKKLYVRSGLASLEYLAEIDFSGSFTSGIAKLGGFMIVAGIMNKGVGILRCSLDIDREERIIATKPPAPTAFNPKPINRNRCRV
jgi:hypothetical protein